MSVQRITSSTPMVNVFHARPVAKPVLPMLLVTSVLLHWFSKRIIVYKDAAKDTSSQAPDVLDAQTTVLDVLQPTNVSTARTISSFKEVLATPHVHPVLLQTEVPSNVLPVTSHAEHVPVIQAHVPAVNQEKVSCKLQEPTRSVLRNALKELIQKMVFVKFVISDVLNVWALLQTVLLVQLEDTCSTPLVGITVQESSTPLVAALTNVHRDTSDNLTNNVSNALQNAVHAAAIQPA